MDQKNIHNVPWGTKWRMFHGVPIFASRQSGESKGHFMHVTKGREKNDLGLLVVMVGHPETTTNRNPHHFSKALVT